MKRRTTETSVMPSNLVAWYKMNETGDVLLDYSGNKQHGLLVGAVRVNGKSGGALFFAGATEYASIPGTILPTTDFSISMWINPTASPSSYQRFLTLINGGNNLQLAIRSNQIAWRYSGVAKRGNETIPLGSYSNFILVNSSGVMSMYINTIQTTDTVTGPTADGNYSAIGGGYSNSYMFNGNIDDVRVYDIALSLEQRRDVYMEGGK